MFSSIKIKLANFIRNKIILYASRKGIAIKIKRTFFSGLKFNMEKVSLFNKTEDVVIEMDKMTFRILFWRALCNMSLVGELKFYNLSSNWNVISNKTFIIRCLDIKFKLRNKNRISVNFEIDNISLLLFFHKTKNNIELFFDLPSITWDDIIRIFQDHFFFNYLKSLESSNKITIQAYFKKYLLSQRIPFFNAKIGNDDFLLKVKKSNAAALINKDFLLETLYKKRGEEFRYKYVTIDKISPDLINSIICAEDPNFWEHDGIDFFFIGYALDSNIKSNKINRGASTITMQLVRNLFLHHGRTLMRKLEEAIITILLENYFKIDKKTIFELYLNIIEFAPKIYGIKEATSFYFNKKPCQLTLVECLVITYIIPRPKYFLEALMTNSAQLKRNLYKHITIYSRVMLDRGHVSQELFDSLSYTITFASNFGKLDCNESQDKQFIGQS